MSSERARGYLSTYGSSGGPPNVRGPGNIVRLSFMGGRTKQTAAGAIEIAVSRQPVSFQITGEALRRSSEVRQLLQTDGVTHRKRPSSPRRLARGRDYLSATYIRDFGTRHLTILRTQDVPKVIEEANGCRGDV